MATLKVNSPKPVKLPPKTYTLTLNETEVAVVRYLIGCIRGLETPGTAQYITGKIYNLLKNAGAPTIKFENYVLEKGCDGIYHLYFPDNGKFKIEKESE